MKLWDEANSGRKSVNNPNCSDIYCTKLDCTKMNLYTRGDEGRSFVSRGCSPDRRIAFACWGFQQLKLQFCRTCIPTPKMNHHICISDFLMGANQIMYVCPCPWITAMITTPIQVQYQDQSCKPYLLVYWNWSYHGTLNHPHLLAYCRSGFHYLQTLI